LAVSPAFSNAVDVLVLGCAEENYFKAAAVVFPEGEAPDLLANDSSIFLCSPSTVP